MPDDREVIRMLSSSLERLDLDDFHAPSDQRVRHRGSWITWSDQGTAGSTTYFEVPVGCRLGRHTHSAEETVILLEGAARATVGEEETTASAPHLLVVPAGAEHDLANTGAAPLRAIGFFPVPSVETVFETELEPGGSKEMGSPDRT